jgi:hypothetical protein
MAINFAAAFESARAQMDSKAIEAIVLGTSGAGKSFLLGSFGVSTLYIYFSGESHGPRAAAKRAKETGSVIHPICGDLGDDGKQLTADAAIARVLEILNSEEILDTLQIGAIALDGAAELEVFIRASEKFKKDCVGSNGKHNNFAEPTVTNAHMRPILNRLKQLQRERGIHFALTCMLDCKEYGEFNDIVEATPRLRGFQVAESLVQQFGDVLVTGPMKRDGQTKWKLQFMSDLSKVSKEVNGTVKRAVNFNPRLNGATPPAYLDADMREVIRLKELG